MAEYRLYCFGESGIGIVVTVLAVVFYLQMYFNVPSPKRSGKSFLNSYCMP
jgi:hypothetical protein